MGVDVRPLSGNAFLSAIPALSNLRIRIFRNWPYLYDGDLEYEEKYLRRFIEADRAFLAAAFDGEEIVGAATAAPLDGETEEFRNPFEEAGYDVSKIFYFAESLLLPQYRGHGVGHAFFDAREIHAKSFGEYTHAVFCGVVRPEAHPARPAEYRPLDAFWRKRGFEKLDGLTTEFSWKDVGEKEETVKPMQFWMKEL
ncbi:MAG: GNAT family N-acetyltransferase [Pseudomonadota bacterium]